MAPRNMLPGIIRLFSYASLTATSLAQRTRDAPQKTVEDWIPLLANNDDYTPASWRTRIGGQNFTWCCTKAVADSVLVDENDNLVLAEDGPAIDLNLSALQTASDQGQFPCTASYDEDHAGGSPEIKVNYTWLAENCPGWELNTSENLNAWLQPLSGFLLPAVIFCLSVPRRRKIHVSRSFFVADLAGIKSYLPAFLGAVGAVVIVTIDTLLWLSICFALAGPMILSGLYEALLDSRVIEFVREKTMNRNLTLDMRCRLLMVVLIGNLDLAVEDDDLVTADLRPRQSPRHMPVIAGTRPSLDPILGQNVNASVEAAAGHPSVHPEHGESRAREFLAPGENGLEGIRLEPIPGSEDHDAKLQDGEPRGPGGSGDDLEIYGSGDIAKSEMNIGNSSFISDAQTQTQTQPRTPTAASQRAEFVQADATVVQRRSTAHLQASPWRHMEELLYPIRLYDDGNTSRHLSPRQYPREWHRDTGPDLCPDRGAGCARPGHFQAEQPHCRTPAAERQVRKTQTRLRTMLNCQYSFGSMVGAPVLFFLGGFVFALLQSLQDLGSEDIALALAFGQFYMTVPHIAIVSGLLLAGNNPNILEGVFATQRGGGRHGGGGDDAAEGGAPGRRPGGRGLLRLTFGLAYPSCYKVAWQWHRGRNKRQWIDLLVDTYGQRGRGGWARDRSGARPPRVRRDDNLEDLRDLAERTTPSPLDWFLIMSMTGLLLGIPFVLAFLTAYFTPEVGLSCRSFTFSCYAASQLGQIILWLWENAGPPGMVDYETAGCGLRPLDVFRGGGWLDRHGFYRPRSVDHFVVDSTRPQTPGSIWRAVGSREFRDVRSAWCCLWYSLYVLFCVTAAFAAVGGTLMQVLGVYSADICSVTTDRWVDPFRPGVTAMISMNSRLMIQDAQTYWKPCAITAIAFMSFVSFVGWWYQRRLRDLFMDLVSKIDQDRYAREDSRRAKSSRGDDIANSGVERHLWGSTPM